MLEMAAVAEHPMHSLHDIRANHSLCLSTKGVGWLALCYVRWVSWPQAGDHGRQVNVGRDCGRSVNPSMLSSTDVQTKKQGNSGSTTQAMGSCV